jgi:quercetin dioxygenase-like cupin family protein
MRLRFVVEMLLFLLLGSLGSAAAQGQPVLPYVVIVSDAQGVTHFRNETFAWNSTQASGELPISVTPALDASRIRFVTLPRGYRSDWHPAPAKQFVMVMSGMGEVEVGDGTRRTFGPGSVLLVTDTQVPGHRTNVLGDQDVLLAFVPIP